MKPLTLLLFLVSLIIFTSGCAGPSVQTTVTPTPTVPVLITESVTIAPSSSAVPTTITTPLITAIASAHTVILQGAGDDVRSFTVTNGGIVTFDIKSSGTASFIIWVEDSQGNRINQIVDKTGAYSGTYSERMDEGNYYLDITDNGPWNITITSPS